MQRLKILTIKLLLGVNWIFRNGAFDVILLLALCAPMALLFNFSKLDPSYWLNNFTNAHNQLTTKTLYEVYNSNHEANEELNNLVTLVDTEDMMSRTKIANLIDTIYAMDPMCIAVDFMFLTPQNDIADKALVETVKRVRDKTVFGYMLEDYKPETQSFSNAKHSFFLNPQMPEWYCDSVLEGYANMKNDGTSDPIWKYSVAEKLRNEKVYSLPAMMMGAELFKDSIPHKEYIINYKKLDMKILSPNNLSVDDIKNHMIIIGAYNYSGDKFDTPLGMIPGMLIHTYIIQSINTDCIVVQSKTDNLRITTIVLLFLIMFLLVLDILILWLKEKCKWTFTAMILEGIFPSVVIGIIAVISMKAYSYHLLIDCNVFTHGQSAFNGILVATAIVKVIYTASMIALCQNNLLGFITKHSIYRKVKS